VRQLGTECRHPVQIWTGSFPLTYFSLGLKVSESFEVKKEVSLCFGNLSSHRSSSRQRDAVHLCAAWILTSSARPQSQPSVGPGEAGARCWTRCGAGALTASCLPRQVLAFTPALRLHGGVLPGRGAEVRERGGRDGNSHGISVSGREAS